MFIDLMKKKGAKNVRFISAPGYNHFTVRAGSKELLDAMREMADLLREKNSQK
jgi:hypothetical protein